MIDHDDHNLRKQVLTCVAGRGDLAVLWFSDLLPRSWGFVPCLVGTAVHTQSTKLRIVSKITPHPPSHAAIRQGV